ncbi:hypothetical protein SJAV_17120 [Sulfurisphaera javensis]|uniref:Hemerythrin-like domain-containing protein n=1 Tax=Sulfurisphaera javensis TaxID=2049879 RepID=A0AAT9GSB1_9CREN
MDVITLLKIEHGILRVRFQIIKELLDQCESKAFLLLEETHNFVVKWHAMIEDKYVFPLYGEKAKPFSHDHLLIEKYGNSVLKERRKDWVERYIKIVLDHNLNEENQLFDHNVNIPLSKILGELENFKDYNKITGLDLTKL